MTPFHLTVSSCNHSIGLFFSDSQALRCQLPFFFFCGAIPTYGILPYAMTTMALHHLAQFYCLLPWHYITLLDSTKPTIVLLHSACLYITLPCFYFTLWFYITLLWLYFTLLDSTLLYHGSTSLLDSILTVPSLHFTPLDSTLLYLIALLSTKICITLLGRLYIILPWLYFALHISTAFQAYHSSISLCVTLHYSTMAIFHSTITQLDSTLLFNGSISLYLTLLLSTMALFHSTAFHHGSTSLYCLLP